MYYTVSHTLSHHVQYSMHYKPLVRTSLIHSNEFIDGGGSSGDYTCLPNYDLTILWLCDNENTMKENVRIYENKSHLWKYTSFLM